MASRLSDPLHDAFGAAVRELRQRRGLSKEALAEIAELARTYLTEVEHGRRNLTGELMTVAERHLPTSEVFGDTHPGG